MVASGAGAGDFVEGAAEGSGEAAEVVEVTTMDLQLKLCVSVLGLSDSVEHGKCVHCEGFSWLSWLYVSEVAVFLHGCEGEAVTRLTNEKIPYFNAPIYLENKTQIGKVEEIFGPINDAVSMNHGAG